MPNNKSVSIREGHLLCLWSLEAAGCMPQAVMLLWKLLQQLLVQSAIPALLKGRGPPACGLIRSCAWNAGTHLVQTSQLLNSLPAVPHSRHVKMLRRMGVTQHQA